MRDGDYTASPILEAHVAQLAQTLRANRSAGMGVDDGPVSR